MDFDAREYDALYALPLRDRIRVLLLDIDPFDRQAVLVAAGRCRQLELEITPCRSLADARELVAVARYDVIFVEYWLGLDTSIAFIREIAANCLALCVVLTSLDEPDIRRLVFRAGAHGFLSKDSLSPQALESVTLAVLRAHSATEIGVS